MTTTTAKPAEVVRRPLMSGHCSAHDKQHTLSEQGAASHERCDRNGGGNRANPAKEFQPCPCPHHYGTNPGGEAEVFECGGCGKEIVEADYWPLDEDGDVRYTHIDGTGRALGEDCYTAPPKRDAPVSVSGNVKDCVRCGEEFTGNSRSKVCPSCTAIEADAEDDFADLDVDEHGDPVDEVDALLAEFDLDDEDF